MTKNELQKCEELMGEALKLAAQAKEEYDQAEKAQRNGNLVECEIQQRKADQHYGEAVGINQVLAKLNFKHNEMKKLTEML